MGPQEVTDRFQRMGLLDQAFGSLVGQVFPARSVGSRFLTARSISTVDSVFQLRLCSAAEDLLDPRDRVFGEDAGEDCNSYYSGVEANCRAVGSLSGFDATQEWDETGEL